MKKYIISWKSKITEKFGHGNTTFSLKEAEKICYNLNCKFPNTQHSAILSFPAKEKKVV